MGQSADCCSRSLETCDGLVSYRIAQRSVLQWPVVDDDDDDDDDRYR